MIKPLINSSLACVPEHLAGVRHDPLLSQKQVAKGDTQTLALMLIFPLLVGIPGWAL